jgi:tryptophan synthase beta chain
MGSVLNHVMLHQTVIGLETHKQLELAGDYPDVVIGCVGGGSNFAGLALPFVRDKLTAGKKTRIVAAEPTACPSLTRGLYRYDFGDSAGLTPLLKMHTLGHDFMPPPIHAGGLRYHGMSPILCHLYDLGLIEAQAHQQNAVFQSAVLFARTEGHLPAPETAHAIHAAVEEARRCRERGEAKTIVFGASGHGHFDLVSYQKYFAGELTDYEYPEELIRKAQASLPVV